MMELFRTHDFYIFSNGEHSLWWDRQTGAFIPKMGWDLADADDPICLGICDGIIGKVEHSSWFDPRLLLIKESLPIGKLHGDNIVHKIKSVVFLPLGPENVELNLQPCHSHKSLQLTKKESNPIIRNVAFTKTWGTLKSAGNSIKNTTQQAAAIATGVPKKREFKDKEKLERQIIDQFTKIFNDTNSFYFSKTTDLTNSLQRLLDLEKNERIDPKCLWKTVDDRFFWNYHMLQDLINLNNPLCNPWILPIIQGYIQIERCKIELVPDRIQNVETTCEAFRLGIISRRSRFRAGTRYKRRGVDEEGHCANYVETEQLIAYREHEVSFVQVRGSVPVYWSQPTYKYRPPPRIDKGEGETRVAFEKHFTQEIDHYGPIFIVNLIEQTGKEKVIYDAYSNHVFQYDSPDLTYATFDFHEYCKGLHYENVSILINALADVIKNMNYRWKNLSTGIDFCSQSGVFRVNCIDCLDRTNVVQTALGKAVMEIQLYKLGLISPEDIMPNSVRNTFQLLWANNGDIISKQYAGTNALKGDYTRTGERNMIGLMKDGMNSANRYYKNHFKDSIRQCCLDIMQGVELNEIEIQDFWTHLRIITSIAGEILPANPPSYSPQIALQQEFELANVLYEMSRYYLSRFKDTTRQGTIDLMLGNTITEDMLNDSRTQFEEDPTVIAEHVKLLIEDCKKMLINEPESALGAWGLINSDPSTGDPNETEMDTMLILTRDSYFVADYDDQVDKVTKYQRVLLRDIALLECGLPETGPSLFKQTKNRFCVRINYCVDGVMGYYHMFRSTNLRFFNNMAVVIRSEEEEIESLKAICEAFSVALEIADLPVIPFVSGRSLDRRRSKVITYDNPSSSVYLDIVGLPMTRNVSESQLLAIKNAGSKALSNMSQQFSKLNKIGSSFKKSKVQKANFTIGVNRHESSSDSEDDYENSIFQPRASLDENSLQYATDSSSTSGARVERALEACEEPRESAAPDAFLPSVGIVMSGGGGGLEGGTLEQKENLLTRADSSQVDTVQLSSIMRNVSLQSAAPEIQISAVGCDKTAGSGALKLDKKLSHSSGEVDDSEAASCRPGFEQRFDKRSVSEYDVQANISQSQSESALKNKLANLTSPGATKEVGFSPFSKLAKGVQSFGANLDPRKLGGQVRQVNENQIEEHRKFLEKWANSKTRLIAL